MAERVRGVPSHCIASCGFYMNHGMVLRARSARLALTNLADALLPIDIESVLWRCGRLNWYCNRGNNGTSCCGSNEGNGTFVLNRDLRVQNGSSFVDGYTVAAIAKLAPAPTEQDDRTEHQEKYLSCNRGYRCRLGHTSLRCPSCRPLPMATRAKSSTSTMHVAGDTVAK